MKIITILTVILQMRISKSRELVVFGIFWMTTDYIRSNLCKGSSRDAKFVNRDPWHEDANLPELSTGVLKIRLHNVHFGAVFNLYIITIYRYIFQISSNFTLYIIFFCEFIVILFSHLLY